MTPVEARADPRAELGTTDSVGAHGRVALVDLLDRLLGSGVVVAGDLVISMAGVDLVEIRLNALIATVRAELEPAEDEGGTP